jgi:diphthine-ammonia ligase
MTNEAQDFEAPTLFLGIKSLPRDALVEKQVLLHTGRCLVVDADDEEPSLQARPPRTERGTVLELQIA